MSRPALSSFGPASIRRAGLVLAGLALATGCSDDESPRPGPVDAPTIGVIAPAAWSVISGDVQVTVLAPNAEMVQLRLGEQLIDDVSGPPFLLHWDTVGLANGHHRPRIVALNAGGSVDSTIDVVTDNAGRGVAVVAPVSEQSVGIGGAVQLGVIVVGDENHEVTWDIEETPGTGARGTVGGSGLYSAPPHVPDPSAVVLIATSVADPTKNARITLRITGVSVQVTPAVATVEVGRTYAFAAHVFGADDSSVTWDVPGGPGHGSITPEGVYTAPDTLPDPPAVTVRATSVADPSRSSTASVTVVPPPPPIRVEVSPASASVLVGATKQFSATVVNATDARVQWTVSAGAGTIDETGLYTAPGSLPAVTAVTVSATSVQDPTRHGSAAITLTSPPPVMIRVTPGDAIVIAGTSRLFTATVSNTADTRVTWSVSSGGGVIDDHGLYRAPSVIPDVPTVMITATSVADPTRSASAPVLLVASAPLPADLDGILDVLAGTGRQAAQLSDQAMNLVVTVLHRAQLANGGAVTTAGTLRLVGKQGLVYEPPAAGQTSLILLATGPRIELTTSRLQAAWLNPPFLNRLFGCDFRGMLTARLVIDGVADLQIMSDSVPGSPDYQTSFERTLAGSVLIDGTAWTLDLSDDGEFEESFHGGNSRHRLTGPLSIAGRAVTLDDVVTVSYYEGCHQPGGGFVLFQQRRFGSTVEAGGFQWALTGEVRRSVDLNCGFYERVYGTDWVAEGGLFRSGEPAGAIGFDGAPSQDTEPPVAGVMFMDRGTYVLPLPRWYEKLLPNPFTP